MVEDQLNFLPAVSPVQPWVENLIGDLLFYSFSTFNMNHFKSMNLEKYLSINTLDDLKINILKKSLIHSTWNT